MITEDYVLFETAKCLKEKGFDVPVKNYYSLYTEDAKYNLQKKYGAKKNWNSFALAVSRPSQSLVMKWLREVHHLFIGVEPRLSFTDYYWITANIYRVRKKNSLYHAEPVDDYSCVACCDGDSFEEACEAGIKYCIENLI